MGRSLPHRWLILALIYTLLLPNTWAVNLGALVLTPYRVVLLAGVLVCVLDLFRKSSLSVYLSDMLVFAHVGLVAVAVGVAHGPGRAIESGGIYAVELLGGYLIVRSVIRSVDHCEWLISCLCRIFLVLFPFIIIESLFRVNIWSTILSLPLGKGVVRPVDIRFGLARATGPFDHPILLGLFGAMWIGFVIRPVLLLQDRASRRARWIRLIVCPVIVLSALSSGALATMLVQFVLLAWRRFVPGQIRWYIFAVLFATGYIGIDLFSNRTPLRVILHYLTFSAETAYYRMAILEHGSAVVRSHPMWGIGFHDWVRPVWMYSSSVDNFWLLTAMRFGLPCLTCLVLAIFVSMGCGWRRQFGRVRIVRQGWLFSMVGLIVGAFTVHLWNHSFVLFSLLLGVGVSLQAVPEQWGASNKSRASTVSHVPPGVPR